MLQESPSGRFGGGDRVRNRHHPHHRQPAVQRHGGTLPGIRWIFSHGGGTVPFLLSRFTHEEKIVKNREEVLPRGVIHELKKFYYDTAQANHRGALNALTRLAPVARILLGSDFPFRPAQDVVAGLGAYGFTARELRAIERDNAIRLLPTLKR